MIKPPFWKKWLSYLSELPIESVESDISETLHVSLLRGRYQLYTENAIYSFDDLYDNFRKCFLQLDLDQLQGRDVLILGFGLGSIPIILEKDKPANWHFTGIEMDETVIYLANKYSIPRISSPLEMIQADAFSFVQQCQRTFDVICMDIFINDKVPSNFETDSFLMALKNLLSPSGILIFNKLSRTQSDKNQAQHFYKYTFSNVFPESTYLEIEGNWLLLSNASFLTQ